MRKSLFAALLISTALSAQSPLTTLFGNNNSGSAGGTVMFDMTVNVPLSITQIDVNAFGAGGLPGTLEVRTCATSYIGNELNPAAWTSVSAGNPLTTNATNTPTPCILGSPVLLTPGTYGIMLKADSWQHAYTNGTGANQNYSNAEMSLSLGAAQNVEYTAAFTPRVANVSIYYQAGGNVATKRKYGQGCIRNAGTVYEFFATAGAFDLNTTSISLIYNGSNGYLALPGINPFVAPTAAATQLTLGDDTETTITLGSSFTYPGGSTTSLTVCSNGFISVAPGNGTGFTPVEATFLGFAQTAWANWHDYNPAAGGAVRFEEVGNLSIVTWDGVVDFGQTTPNTFQFQFDRATGNVDIVFQSISGLGNAHIVGYKCGGAVLPVTSSDISALLPATFQVGCDTRALDFDASARPVLGTTINLVTTNIRPGTAVTIHRLTFGSQVPGLDLTPLGAPGCFAHVNPLGPSNIFLVGSPSTTSSLALPNNPALAGTTLFGQAASLVPGINALGIITSNGLELIANVN